MEKQFNDLILSELDEQFDEYVKELFDNYDDDDLELFEDFDDDYIYDEVLKIHKLLKKEGF